MTKARTKILGIAALVVGLVFVPGVLPVTIGVIAARAIRRVRARRQIKRIVVSYGQRADQWGEA